MKVLRDFTLVILIVGILVLIGGIAISGLGGLTALGLATDTPTCSAACDNGTDNPADAPVNDAQYALGEAAARVESVYNWPASNLVEAYLGEGVWEVTSLTKYLPVLSQDPVEYGPPTPAIFRVYEDTDQAEMYNNMAKAVIEGSRASTEKKDKDSSSNDDSGTGGCSTCGS